MRELGPVVAIAAFVLLIVLVSLYNRLVRARNGVNNAFSTIDVQLKQRCDLIPKVVDTVRGYMSHERGVLEQLTSLRAQATSPGLPAAQRVALDGQMAGLLHGLVARVEAYPDLKASETVVMLQRSLNEVESQIAAARRTYNAAATSYNITVESVPTNMVAGLFGFRQRQLFEAAADDRAVPQVASLPR
jgi:LemA protein